MDTRPALSPGSPRGREGRRLPAGALQAPLLGLLLVLAPAGAQVPPSPTPAERARALNEQGVKHYDKREFKEAVARFEEAHRLAPGNEVIARNLARALHGRSREAAGEGGLAEAITCLRRAIALDGTEAAFPVGLGRLLQKNGDAAEARRVLLRALRDHPDSADVHEALGRLEYDEENLQDALDLLEGAARLDPARRERLGCFIEKVGREVRVERGYFRDRRGLFTVKYDDETFRPVSEAVLDHLDRHYNRLGRELGHWPDRNITVVLYTRGDFDLATGARDWTGGLFDGKIRLPVRNYRQASREIAATLAHELTHLFVRSMTRRCPLWLNEGLAQVQEGRLPDARVQGLLRSALAQGKLERMSRLPSSWVSAKNRSQVSLYYAQSLAFTAFLRNRYGWQSLSQLLSSLDRARSFETAFEEVFRVRLRQLEDDWRRELGVVPRSR